MDKTDRVFNPEEIKVGSIRADKIQSNVVSGLPVAGYNTTQEQWKVDLVNQNKVLEEQVLRQIDYHAGGPFKGELDQRCVAEARTAIQTAFMWLNRGVFQPQRVKLPGDPQPQSTLPL